MLVVLWLMCWLLGPDDWFSVTAEAVAGRRASPGVDALRASAPWPCSASPMACSRAAERTRRVGIDSLWMMRLNTKTGLRTKRPKGVWGCFWR